MAKRVQVIKIDNDDDAMLDALQATKDALRALRPLGVRFSVETVDGADTTVSAWLEEREPKAKKERQALGSAIPPSAGAE